MYEASQELAYLDNVIQESLRLYPPAPRYNIIIIIMIEPLISL